MVVIHRNCEDYEGMVLCIAIKFDTSRSKYELDLQWECLGAWIFMVIHCRNATCTNLKPRKIIGVHGEKIFY